MKELNGEFRGENYGISRALGIKLEAFMADKVDKALKPAIDTIVAGKNREVKAILRQRVTFTRRHNVFCMRFQRSYKMISIGTEKWDMWSDALIRYMSY